jgi:hypothetical protein
VPSRKAKGWRCDYERKLLEIWEDYRGRDVNTDVVIKPDDAPMDYIKRRLARNIPGSVSATSVGFAATNGRLGGRKIKQATSSTTIDDEYARYCAEDVLNSHHYRNRPIDWWKINTSRFPRLSVMAVDMLTIPSSSAESERTFSSAGRMMAPLRNRMRRETVAIAQCIRSWSRAGIYGLSMPLLQVDDEKWADALVSL